MATHVPSAVPETSAAAGDDLRLEEQTGSVVVDLGWPLDHLLICQVLLAGHHEPCLHTSSMTTFSFSVVAFLIPALQRVSFQLLNACTAISSYMETMVT